MLLMRWVIVACLLCLGATAGAAADELNWGTWAEQVRKQHPLAGSFYVVAPPPPTAERPWRVPVTTLFGKADFEDRVEGSLIRPLPPDGRGLILAAVHLSPRIVLLGEVHDNPMHHQVRAWLIENAAQDWFAIGARPSCSNRSAPTSSRRWSSSNPSPRPAAARPMICFVCWSGTSPAGPRRRSTSRCSRPSWPRSCRSSQAICPVIGCVRSRAAARLLAEDRARLKLDNPMPASLADALQPGAGRQPLRRIAGGGHRGHGRGAALPRCASCGCPAERRTRIVTVPPS